jgi:hypothetical protein
VRFVVCLVIVAGAVGGGSTPAAQGAARVLVMERDGDVRARIDRALPAASALLSAPARAAASARRRRPRARTFRAELKRLRSQRRIEQATHDRCRTAFDAALRSARRLEGARRLALQGVASNAHEIAARGALTPSRLRALCLTLERNREWWTTGPLLGANQRVEFDGSELVWQHYPGEGLQIQPLGTFGKANGLWQAGHGERLRALLDEMLTLAARRAGGIAWEYYFDFGGGRPPWTSAMSQATGVQALARAGQLLAEPAYRDAARRALPVFQLPPPSGVRVAGPVGTRYLIYSYAPTLHVLNAAVQTLVGLLDYARLTGEPTAVDLFAAGDRQARRDVRAADTGAWSLYSLGGGESSLAYHVLLRDFLRNLCERTFTRAYCETAASFTEDLREPPETRLLTKRVRARRPVLVRFTLSKIARVGMTIRRDGDVVHATSATVARGEHGYSWVPPRRGEYEVTLSATDLAGNEGRSEGTIEVLRRRPRPAPRNGGGRP